MTPIAPTSFPIRAAAIAALAAALAAAGVAPASGQGVDLRSPDARDAGTASQPSYVDLRSPDARDSESAGAQQGLPTTDVRHAALGSEPRAAAPSVDLRSPDARDAERAGAPSVDLRSPDARDAGRPTPAPASPQPVSQPSTPDSDGWLSPAIAGAVLALMLAVLLTTRHRRRHHAVA